MRQYGTTQSQHCNNDNDDNMLCANVWFEFFGELFKCQSPWYMRGKCEISSLGFRDIREVVTLRRLGCNIVEHTHAKILVSTLGHQVSWCNTSDEIFDHYCCDLKSTSKQGQWHYYACDSKYYKRFTINYEVVKVIVMRIGQNKGLVYTMYCEVGPWKMAFFYGPTSWLKFHGPIS